MGELNEVEIPDDADLVKEIQSNLKAFKDHYRDWRTESREAYDFFASKQWSDEDSKILEDQGRPAVVFNRIARTINAVTGLELQNRQEVNYKPMQIDDGGVTDLMNSAAKWVRSNCDAEDEESESFQDTLICGIGATETSVDYTVDQDGMIIVERLDPFEIAFDWRAKKKNCDDKKWISRSKAYSKDEFEEMYPDVDLEAGGDNSNESDAGMSIGHADDEYAHKDAADESKKGSAADDYTVIKYQYVKEEPIFRVAVQGQLVELSQKEYDAVRPHLEQMGLKAGAQKKKVYRQVLLCRNTILSSQEEREAPVEGFSIRLITGLRNRNENTWFGLVQLMKDPQRWANKWLSQIQYILNSNAKGGVTYESDAFVNPKKAKADWSKPDAFIEVTPGSNANGKIVPRVPPQYPDGIDRLLQQALSAINDVPGVNVEMLGIADRNQPGVIENSRKDAGVTILASFFDALRRYRKEQGRVLSMFIRKYISDGRLVRIDNVNGPKYAQLLTSGLAEKYDILVDDAPTSPNMKEKTFAAVQSMLQVALQAQIPIPPEILEYSPLPAALVEKWMKLIHDQQADPSKQKAHAIDEATKISTVKMIDSETAKNQSQAQLNAAKAAEVFNPAVDGSQAAAAQKSFADGQIEFLKGQAAQVKAGAEVQKSQNEIKKELIKSATTLQKGQMDLHKSHIELRKTLNQSTTG